MMLSAEALGQDGCVVYQNNFEVAAGSAWSNAKTEATPVGGRRFLGQFGNQTVRLSLSGLPAHTALSVSFDLFIIRSWDGNSRDFGPEVWDLRVVGGPTLLHTTFSNTVFPPQAYPGDHPGRNYLLERLGLKKVAEPPATMVASWRRRPVLLRPDRPVRGLEHDPRWFIVADEEVTADQ